MSSENKSVAQSIGHGHVRPRPDGVKARCGGPRLCRVCQAEQAALAHPAPAEPSAAQYPLPDDLYDSKDWRAGTYAQRVEWLHAMYEACKRERDALLAPAEAGAQPTLTCGRMAATLGEDGRYMFGHAIPVEVTYGSPAGPTILARPDLTLEPSDIADAARVIAWARDPQRKPAAQAFTAGPERQAAYWIEWAWAEKGENEAEQYAAAWVDGNAVGIREGAERERTAMAEMTVAEARNIERLWALVERYADAAVEFNRAVDKGDDADGYENACRKAEAELCAALLAAMAAQEVGR